jgi:hypothetical protein
MRWGGGKRLRKALWGKVISLHKQSGEGRQRGDVVVWGIAGRGGDEANV